MLKIKKIILYNEPAVKEIQIDNLEKFLSDTFDVPVEIRNNILENGNESLAREIASCRVFNPRRPFQRHSPTSEEIDFEMQNFSDTSKTENIIMYDGFEFQKLITKLLQDDELDSEILHVAFTNKLMCTYDDSDYRYHGRTLIGSNPSIISTTGVIEAPAKPREYYFELMTNFSMGINVDTLKKKYSGTYLEHHDKRLSKVLEGYLLQAVFYYFTGEPFCEDVKCRLFNAHWQKDLLYSQLEIGRLCERHQKRIADF